MIAPHQPERRGAPRVAKELPITIAHKLKEWAVKTKDISASGAYCTINRFLAPMTKLHIRFEVPGNPHARQIACQGVVVRIDPPRATPVRPHYHVAIFFNELADHDRLALARFVQQHLQRASSHR